MSVANRFVGRIDVCLILNLSLYFGYQVFGWMIGKVHQTGIDLDPGDDPGIG